MVDPVLPDAKRQEDNSSYEILMNIEQVDIIELRRYRIKDHTGEKTDGKERRREGAQSSSVA